MGDGEGFVLAMLFAIVSSGVFGYVTAEKYKQYKKENNTTSTKMCIIKNEYIKNYDLICMDGYYYLQNNDILTVYQSANSHCNCKK